MKTVQASEAGARHIETEFSHVHAGPLQWAGREHHALEERNCDEN